MTNHTWKEIPVECEKIAIRSLTRQEIKDMADLGYTYLGCAPSMDTANQAVDAALERVLSPEDMARLNSLPNRATLACWKEILKETYGAQDEEKNLPGTSDGTQTPKE